MTNESAKYVKDEEASRKLRQSYLRKVQNGRTIVRPDLNDPRFSEEAEDQRQIRALNRSDGVAEPRLSTEQASPVELESADVEPPQISVDRSRRRYTSAELDAMEQQAISQGMNPQAAKEAAGELTGGVENTENFGSGFQTAIQRTILGLKQAYQYMAGDDAGRQAINEAIKKLEDNPSLGTSSGKLGDAAGTAVQFMGSSGVGTVAGKLAPKAVTEAAHLYLGKPGSVLRSTEQGGVFEAAQPVSPSDASNEEYLMGKAGKITAGAGAGAVTGKIANILTSPGVTPKPERAAVSAQAERLGIKLTPAQRTGDMTLSQYEEGLASRPGSANIIADAREAQQKVLNKKAAEAIGSAFEAPNEAALAEARTRASQGYKPIASIPQMSWDTAYVTELENFAKAQATKATGSTDAAAVAMKLRKGSGKITGNGFLEELQGIRDMSFGARQKGDVATAKQLSALTEIMENYAERKVAALAKKGLISPDAMDQLRTSRTEMAKIHAIEKATEPVTGKVSAFKYLSQEFKRDPASKGGGTSPVANQLREVGETARVLKQVVPYIGSSGTAERIAGQQLVETTQGPFAALRAAGPITKNYLAAKYYMKYGGKPGLLGSRLTPEQNMYVRRLLPGMTISAEQGVND